MTASLFLPIHNGQCLPLGELPYLDCETLREAILQGVAEGQRLACLCADSKLSLLAVMSDDATHELRVGRTRLTEPRYPSLTPLCPQAHLFERELAEEYGILPVGHPWLKPVRSQEGLPTDFYAVKGEEVHEVAVGPVHAGVIEPGHFRFQCHGEQVFHLEIALGYQHRGIERALLGGPNALSMAQAETISGDASIAHGWAHCQLLEGLAGLQVPHRSELVRGVALELERMANHVGDLGALAGDVGFLPSAAFCGRIRGDWLNLSSEVCGSRLGRNWLTPGGLRRDLEPILAERLLPRMTRAWRDTQDALNLLWGTASVLNRFEAAGHLDPLLAREIGLVGVAVRACGIAQDVRTDHPFGPYLQAPIPVSLAHEGHVQARAWVRWLELQESYRFLERALQYLMEIPVDPTSPQLPPLAPESLCISLTEGWRGEVLHLALTDAGGRFVRYKIVDPSFHNWLGLALAMRGEQISDFPLCNKSFNLSYCGHDL